MGSPDGREGGWACDACVLCARAQSHDDRWAQRESVAQDARHGIGPRPKSGQGTAALAVAGQKEGQMRRGRTTSQARSILRGSRQCTTPALRCNWPGASYSNQTPARRRPWQMHAWMARWMPVPGRRAPCLTRMQSKSFADEKGAKGARLRRGRQRNKL